MMINPGNNHQFSTPAKINLFLRIQQKRPDGYHELLLDFIPVSLFDQITLLRTEGKDLELDGNFEDINLEDNLVVKAVRLLEKTTGKDFPLHIRLEKRIPAGAGLGGGSGNAAGMLVVLNRLFNLSLSEKQLKQLGLQLGADVPFFISSEPSLARGIGEQLTPLPDFNTLYLLLIYPGFPISTAEAYRQSRISGETAPLSTYKIEEISSLTPEMNDFWSPLSGIYPELVDCQSALLESGACAAGLSGSGSTVFGVYQTKGERDQAFSTLCVKAEWQVYACESMRRYDYPIISA